MSLLKHFHMMKTMDFCISFRCIWIYKFLCWGKEYDHIYVAFRMADTQMGENILVNDWIGLGGMDYYGIGFQIYVCLMIEIT